MKFSIPMNKRETIWGIAYLIAQFFLLPAALTCVNGLLPQPLNTAQLNFAFYLLNFLAILLIFRRFLWQSIEGISLRPGYFFRVVLLGLGRYLVINMLVGNVIYWLDPSYMNANDAAIQALVSNELTLMALGTIVLVPPVEECLFRGLIFGRLYARSPFWAYVISITLFSLIHILGYIGVYTPMELLISFLSYLPAGLCLGWAYTRADTIFAPIMIHAAVNAIGIYGMR